MTWYNTGTVSVTSGSAVVTGSGTAWTTYVDAGQGFMGPDGKLYEIASVVSATQITLSKVYAGSTASGQAYSIAPLQGYIRDLSISASSLLNSFATVRDGVGAGKFPDGSVSVPAVRFDADEDTGIYRPGVNTLGVVTAGSERVRVDASGNVGIGTASPTEKFQVNVSDGQNAVTALGTNGSGVIYLRPDGVNGNSIRYGGGGLGANVFRLLGGGDIERFRIHSNGYVGIGVSDPQNRLDVSGSIGIVDDQQYRWGTGGTRIAGSHASNYIAFINNGGSERMRVASGGNVGIGTTNPSARLEVVGDLKLNNGGADGAGLILTSNGYSDWTNDNNSGRWRVFYGASEKFSVDGPSSVVTVNGSTLYVNAAKLLLQHDASNAYIRSNTGYLYLGGDGSNVICINGGQLRPVGDNTVALGGASYRYSVVYAATGSINTSDERSKQQIESIPDEWLDAWGDVEWSRYKFNDAVALKGDAEARWHLGLVAQRVRDAFANRNLDAFTIGLLCHDEWDEETKPIYEEVTVPAVIDEETGEVIEAERIEQVDTGEVEVTLEAGDRYGLRYEECFAIEAAWQRRRMAQLEARIAALEAA